MKICTFTILILLLSGCGESSQDTAQKVDITPTIVLSQIAGKSKSEVDAVLGIPSGDETITNNDVSYPKAIYRNGQVEIVFVDSKADWITIFFQELFYEELSSFQKAAFSSAVLSHLGLPIQDPSFSSQALMRWTSIPNILELAVFPNDQGNVRYVYVNINTKP